MLRCARLGLAIVLLGLPTPGAAAGALQPLPDFGPNPGNLDAFVHVPAGVGPGAPLVVALHGCSQRASDFADATGLDALADAVPFVLLLPQQREANNPRRCFNFFDRTHNRPGRGESGSIAAMIDHVEATFATDPARVFALGLSAGGGMTAVLLANDPERFAGGGILAGVPFDCNRPGFWNAGLWWALATFVGQGAAASLSCGIFGYAPVDRTPRDWGDAVRAAPETAPATWPVVSIWQGEADATVHPLNRRELIEQWTDVHAIDSTPDQVERIGPIRREVFADATGRVRVEAWQVPDLGHAAPIDPAGEPACGIEAPHAEDARICAVREIARFWGLVP